eukprot:SAG31_NODE_4205_length_3474_cov_8.209481_3_plen_314_part_00
MTVRDAGETEGRDQSEPRRECTPPPSNGPDEPTQRPSANDSSQHGHLEPAAADSSDSEDEFADYEPSEYTNEQSTGREGYDRNAVEEDIRLSRAAENVKYTPVETVQRFPQDRSASRPVVTGSIEQPEQPTDAAEIQPMQEPSILEFLDDNQSWTLTDEIAGDDHDDVEIPQTTVKVGPPEDTTVSVDLQIENISTAAGTNTSEQTRKRRKVWDFRQGGWITQPAENESDTHNATLRQGSCQTLFCPRVRDGKDGYALTLSIWTTPSSPIPREERPPLAKSDGASLYDVGCPTAEISPDLGFCLNNFQIYNIF